MQPIFTQYIRYQLQILFENLKINPIFHTHIKGNDDINQNVASCEINRGGGTGGGELEACAPTLLGPKILFYPDFPMDKVL